MHLFLRQGYFTDGEVSRARLDLLNAFLAAKRQVAGFFLLNSSVQATNRGPATLEPDPARLIRLWADTAATKANRKPAIVGTGRSATRQTPAFGTPSSRLFQLTFQARRQL